MILPMKTDEQEKKPVTLKWAGGTGDGKRALIEAVENDGWQDVRLELDTDDCDGEFAKRQMQKVIDAVNAYPSYKAMREALEASTRVMERWRLKIEEALPQYCAHVDFFIQCEANRAALATPRSESAETEERK